VCDRAAFRANKNENPIEAVQRNIEGAHLSIVVLASSMLSEVGDRIVGE